VCLLTFNDGKCRFALLVALGINTYAVIGAVVMIPGFIGILPAIKNPADFIFPPRRDKGRILEYS
jgi:hypothetical protein